MAKEIFKERVGPGNLRVGVKAGKKIPPRRAIEFNLYSKFHGHEYVIRGKELFELKGGRLSIVEDAADARIALTNAKWSQKSSLDKTKMK